MTLLREREPRPTYIDPMDPGDSHEWFIENGLNERLQRGVIKLFGLASSPTVVYRMIPGTGFDALEDIEKHESAGNPTYLRKNHVLIHDFVNDASAVEGSKYMSHYSGGFRIPAGLSYYNKRPIGWIFSKLGVYPANRKIDQIKHLLNTNIFADFDQAKAYVDTEDVNDDRVSFNAKLLAGTLKKVLNPMEAAKSTAKPIQTSYPQGTRQPQDEIGELHDDWHKILSQMDDPENAKIIIFSKYYGGGKFMRRFLTPTIVVDIINAPYGIENKEEANAELKARMEQGIEIARDVPRSTVLSPLAKAGLGLLAVSAGAAAVFASKRAK